MKINNKGSQWRKWDLHIHTPGTNKNDQFKGSNIDEKWDNFIKSVNKSTEEIAVIGITDYFSVENYFKFKQKVTDQEITKKFDFIIPNIELRITPVTGRNKAINIHCLFNPKIENEIEHRFLSKLRFSWDNTSYDATKNSIARLGRNLCPDSKLGEEIAYKKGIEKYVISFDSLRNIFKEDKRLREEVIIVVANNADGVSGLRKHADFFDRQTQTSQLDLIVESIYQFSDAIFSSNPKDRDYFSGSKTSQKEIIEKHHSLMPCFHGCDAHDNSKVFKPTEDRYCWIKADTTFNGLRQTLYEPRERVIVQPTKPEEKQGYYVIESVSIPYNDIYNSEMQFNQGLNCIIGGRSTGKSVLLSAIAKRLKNTTKAKQNNCSYDDFVSKIAEDLKIVWKDGIEKYDREIEFFNQGYMYRYSRDEKMFDELVKSILKEKDNNNLFEVYDSFLVGNQLKISNSLIRLFDTIEKVKEKKQKIADTGDLEGINLELIKLHEELEEAKSKQNFSNQDYDQFHTMKNEMKSVEVRVDTLNQCSNDICAINSNDFFNSFYPDIVDKELKQSMIDLHHRLVLEFKQRWASETKYIMKGVQDEIDHSKQNIENIKKSKIYEKGDLCIKKNDILKEIESQIDIEKEKEDSISILLKTIDRLEQEVIDLKTEILHTHHLYFSKAHNIANRLSQDLGDLKIKAYPKFEEEKYEELLHSSLNLKGDRRKKLATFKHNNNTGVEDYQKEIAEKLGLLLDGNIILKNSYSSKDLVNRLLTESKYRISYEVIYEEDKYSEMSEGKQAFVVLKLLLDFSNKKCPILIDQPEDDLDNRAIYNDLVRYLRIKKKSRQIIVVTHNPNIVIGTDAELVVVANQHGVNTKNKNSKKFQYFGGSIEQTKTLNKESALTELDKQGIREHVCEILEGGETAFKLREKRYNIKRHLDRIKRF